METNDSAVVTYRGNEIENSYQAHVAVVDANGTLLYRWGDPFRFTLARSAAKPAQALSVLETGACDLFGFDDADVALMCASHSSELRHIERTRALLAKVNAKESDLRCGGHAPLSDAVYRDWIKRDFIPTAVCSNCSGKHVGMLAGAQAIGADMTDYHLPDHPMQVRVKRIVAEACGLQEDQVAWAIDGCNLPTPAFPLDRLARLFVQLADSADRIDADTDVDADTPSDRSRAFARLFHAMTRHPEWVGGDGRFCTQLMQAFGGGLVGKVGADACYGIGVRASQDTRRLGADGAIGIAVKMEDGNTTALYMIVSEILTRLQIGTAAQRAALDAFHRPPMRNTRQVTTGHVTFPFELQRC